MIVNFAKYSIKDKAGLRVADELVRLEGVNTFLGTSAKPLPLWQRFRKPWWIHVDRERKRWYAGVDLQIGWLEILWIHMSRGFGRPSFCLKLVGGKRQFNALFMWDTAHIGRLGRFAKWLTPLQSLLWFSLASWNVGTGVQTCQSTN